MHSKAQLITQGLKAAWAGGGGDLSPFMRFYYFITHKMQQSMPTISSETISTVQCARPIYTILVGKAVLLARTAVLTSDE